MVRSQFFDNIGLKKGPWSAEEDEKLLAYIQEHGHGSWRSLPSKAGLERCGKSCRLRWTNYLRPDIKRGNFTLQEEQTIIQLHALLGNRWSAIATHLPKRTDNEIKNYWNTHLKKRLTKMGIDPITHKPQNHCNHQSKEIANISHMAQWESARLQAEARLVVESKLISNPYLSHLTCGTTATPSPPRPPPLAQTPCLDILKVWEWTNPGKDISAMILNGFPPSKWENVRDQTSLFFDVDSVEKSPLSTVGKPSCSYHEGRGIMENLMELDHPTVTVSHSTYAQHSLGFPSGLDLVCGAGNSNNALGVCWGNLEENQANCWSIMDYPLFEN